MKRIKELNHTTKLNSLSILCILKISAQILYFTFLRYLKSTRLIINTADQLSFQYDLLLNWSVRIQVHVLSIYTSSRQQKFKKSEKIPGLSLENTNFCKSQIRSLILSDFPPNLLFSLFFFLTLAPCFI